MIGLSLNAVSGVTAAVWLPTGVALVALVLYGYDLWPGIAVAAFLVNLSIGAPLLFVWSGRGRVALQLDPPGALIALAFASASAMWGTAQGSAYLLCMRSCQHTGERSWWRASRGRVRRLPSRCLEPWGSHLQRHKRQHPC
jgi:hypothetical protein